MAVAADDRVYEGEVHRRGRRQLGHHLPGVPSIAIVIVLVGVRQDAQQRRKAKGVAVILVGPVGGDDDAPRAENLLDASQFAPPKLMSPNAGQPPQGSPPSIAAQAGAAPCAEHGPPEAGFANSDIWRSSRSLPHLGQAGDSLERTRVSNSCAQSAQA